MSNDITNELPGDLISTNAAARLVGLHPNSLRRMIFVGRLRAWRIHRNYRVSRAEVLDLLQPVEYRPNGLPCTKQKPPPRRSKKEEAKHAAWLQAELKAAGLLPKK